MEISASLQPLQSDFICQTASKTLDSKLLFWEIEWQERREAKRSRSFHISHSRFTHLSHNWNTKLSINWKETTEILQQAFVFSCSFVFSCAETAERKKNKRAGSLSEVSANHWSSGTKLATQRQHLSIPWVWSSGTGWHKHCLQAGSSFHILAVAPPLSPLTDPVTLQAWTGKQIWAFQDLSVRLKSLQPSCTSRFLVRLQGSDGQALAPGHRLHVFHLELHLGHSPLFIFH